MNDAFHIGMTNGVYVTQLPMQLTPKLLARGRERFDAICAECLEWYDKRRVVSGAFPTVPKT